MRNFTIYIYIFIISKLLIGKNISLFLTLHGMQEVGGSSPLFIKSLLACQI